MELVIEQGIAMPESSRATAGNSRVDRFNANVLPTLQKMDKEGQSAFVPNYDNRKFENFRRDLVFDTNKAGKKLGKAFRIAPETKRHAEPVLDENGNPVINPDGSEKIHVSQEHGLRVWLVQTGLPIDGEQVATKQSAPKVEAAQEAPEVKP